MATKACIRCFRILDVGEFYAHPEMKDGHLGACKACVKLGARLRSRRSRPARRKYEREREERADRKVQKARTQTRHRINNPLKYKARTAVGNALRDGRLVKRPCAGCGTRVRVQAHHDDYSKPLDVRWMCFRCHREGEHRQETF